MVVVTAIAMKIDIIPMVPYGLKYPVSMLERVGCTGKALALVVHHDIMVRYRMVLIGRRRASPVVRPASGLAVSSISMYIMVEARVHPLARRANVIPSSLPEAMCAASAPGRLVMVAAAMASFATFCVRVCSLRDGLKSALCEIQCSRRVLVTLVGALVTQVQFDLTVPQVLHWSSVSETLLALEAA